MENEAKIFNQLKSAANNAEDRQFAAMDKVWQRVEEKLDNTKTKKATVLWKKIAIAACLLLFGTLGYQFLKADEAKIKTNETVVSRDSIKTINPKEAVAASETIHPALKEDAVQILKKQINPETQVVMEAEKQSPTNAVKEVSSPTISSLNAPVPNATIHKENLVSEAKKSETNNVEMLMQINRKASLVHKDEPLVIIDDKLEKTKIQDIQFNDDDSLMVLNEPLYIINGVEYTEQEVFGPNPTSPYSPLKKQQIETISILQDEKAIEIYGDRGKKGVVIITTKNGKPVASKKAK